jgi:L-rhamnose-H+ transport protein
MPWAGALLLTHDLIGVLRQAPATALFWAWFFGLLWGAGGMMAGLSLRYLGLSLGQGITLGFCAAFGTLVPPIYRGQFGAILGSTSGRVVLAGIGICLAGIAVAALAGLAKERDLAGTRAPQAEEFRFGRGLLVAVLAGIMSAFFSFGLEAASPLAALSAAAGTPVMWTGLPKIVVVLLGGFTTNFLCCVTLNLRNRSAREYLGRQRPVAGASDVELGPRVPSLARNYLACAAAGTTWYLQFFFYTMGETQMGSLQFSSWTLHMASIIIFSTLWGWILREWTGTRARTRGLVALGLALLIASTVVVGLGNYFGGLPT